MPTISGMLDLRGCRIETKKGARHRAPSQLSLESDFDYGQAAAVATFTIPLAACVLL